MGVNPESADVSSKKCYDNHGGSEANNGHEAAINFTGGSREAKLPILHGGKTVAYATVDAADYQKLAKYQWCLTESTGVAYRTIKTNVGPRTVSLSREVVGLSIGDPRRVDVLNGNRLDARRANLSIRSKAGDKAVSENKRGKHWPRKFTSLLSFYEKRGEPRMMRLLSEAKIDTFTRKNVRLGYESDTEIAVEGRLLSTINYLKERFSEDLGFKGSVSTFVMKPQPTAKNSNLESAKLDISSKNDIEQPTRLHAMNNLAECPEKTSIENGAKKDPSSCPLVFQCSSSTGVIDRELFLDSVKGAILRVGVEVKVEILITSSAKN